MNIDSSVVPCAVLQAVRSETHPPHGVTSSNDMVQHNELAAHVGVHHQAPPPAECSERVLVLAPNPSDHVEEGIYRQTWTEGIAPLESSEASGVLEANRPSSNAVVAPTEDEALTLQTPQMQEDVDMAPATRPAPADVPVDDSCL